MRLLNLVTVVAVLVAAGLGGLRFLRVAQREHYLAGSAERFALRWWRRGPANGFLATLAAGGAIAGFVLAPAALATAFAIAAGPMGLGLRGRTSRLAWTRRLKTVAATSALLAGGVVVLGAVADGLAGAAAAGALAACGAPVLIDVALALTAPLERRLASRYVADATRRLQAVRPKVVAITGSYGKTSTKGYVAHLLSGRFSVLASPRSFNNRAGLSRTINELLLPGTEVLVAEMGAFGLGEIASLCAWVPPDVAVITAIGPVHLERFGSLDATLRAKAEITAAAPIVVLNVDDERLAPLAADLEAAGKIVVRASGVDASAGVAVLLERDPGGGGPSELVLYVGGERIGGVERPVRSAAVASNVACAVGVGVALGSEPKDLLARLAHLSQPPNRLTIERASNGATVLDDTFNANPAGARHALELLEEQHCRSPFGKSVLVTPGLVELGARQREENASLAQLAAQKVTHLIVVGRTNRAALLEGARRTPGSSVVRCVENREAAADWVRAELGPDDVVLYENDLPDHYP